MDTMTFPFVALTDSDSVKIAALKTLAVTQVAQRDRVLIESYDKDIGVHYLKSEKGTKSDAVLKPISKASKPCDEKTTTLDALTPENASKAKEMPLNDESETSEPIADEKPVIEQRAKRFTKKPVITLKKTSEPIAEKPCEKPTCAKDSQSEIFAYLDSLTPSEVFELLDSDELSSETWQAWKASRKAQKPLKRVTLKPTGKPSKEPSSFGKSDTLTEEALNHYLKINDESLFEKYEWLEDLIEDLREAYTKKIGVNKCQSIWANACKAIKESLGVQCNPRPTLEECILSIEE